MSPASATARILPAPTPTRPWWRAVGPEGTEAKLFHGDTLDVLPELGLEGQVDLIFADPPYFLSNGGITCRNGK